MLCFFYTVVITKVLIFLVYMSLLYATILILFVSSLRYVLINMLSITSLRYVLIKLLISLHSPTIFIGFKSTSRYTLNLLYIDPLTPIQGSSSRHNTKCRGLSWNVNLILHYDISYLRYVIDCSFYDSTPTPIKGLI